MLAGWLVARKGVVRSGDRGRNWPGGGRGGSPLEGIASPVARRGKDSIGRVAADGKAGADYAGNSKYSLMYVNIFDATINAHGGQGAVGNARSYTSHQIHLSPFRPNLPTYLPQIWSILGKILVIWGEFLINLKIRIFYISFRIFYN